MVTSSLSVSNILNTGLTGEHLEKSHIPWGFLRFTKHMGLVPGSRLFGDYGVLVIFIPFVAH